MCGNVGLVSIESLGIEDLEEARFGGGRVGEVTPRLVGHLSCRRAVRLCPPRVIKWWTRCLRPTIGPTITTSAPPYKVMLSSPRHGIDLNPSWSLRLT